MMCLYQKGTVALLAPKGRIRVFVPKCRIRVFVPKGRMKSHSAESSRNVGSIRNERTYEHIFHRKVVNCRNFSYRMIYPKCRRVTESALSFVNVRTE